MRRTPLKRGPWKRRNRPRDAVTPENAAAREAWHAAIGRTCRVCGRRCGQLQVHHVVYAQRVLQAKGDLWDPRNGMTVGSRCHESHHNASHRIPLGLLSPENWAFAKELLGPAAEDYIARHYPRWLPESEGNTMSSPTEERTTRWQP